MATYTASDYFADAPAPVCTQIGVTRVKEFAIPIASNLANADVLKPVRMPGGHKPYRIFLYSATELDTNGAPTLDFNVGTDTDPDAFASNIAFSQADADVVTLPDEGVLATFFTAAVPSTDYDLCLTVDTGPATGTTGTVRGFVEYGISPTILDPTDSPAVVTS